MMQSQTERALKRYSRFVESLDYFDPYVADSEMREDLYWSYVEAMMVRCELGPEQNEYDRILLAAAPNLHDWIRVNVVEDLLDSQQARQELEIEY